MATRRGQTTPGTRSRPAQTTQPDLTDDEKRLQAEARKRSDLLTASLPPSWRGRVRALQRASITGPEALEVEWAVLVAARDRFVAEYTKQCKAADRQRKQAAQLRRKVKSLPEEDETRQEAEALALDLERAPVDHARAMQIIALLTDAARKAQDSLAVQRPSGYTRVHIEVISGGVRIGGYGPNTTYVDERTADDEALLRRLEGSTDQPTTPETAAP